MALRSTMYFGGERRVCRHPLISAASLRGTFSVTSKPSSRAFFTVARAGVRSATTSCDYLMAFCTGVSRWTSIALGSV